MSIVVTGATGHLGRLIVEGLLRDGVAPSDIVAGGRNLAKLSDLAERGVRVATIDYSDPATLDAAFAGAEKVALVSSSEVGQRFPQHTAVIDAAAAAGVSQLVYTSAPAADTSALILAPDHKATEQYLRASGVPFTILRNGWYTENYVGTVQQAAQTGTIVASVGEGRVASAARADYADAVAAVLTTDGQIGKTYELSGDTAWDFTELASTAAELLGRDVAFVSVSTDDHVAGMIGAGLDEGTAGFVAGLDTNIRDGLLAVTTGELRELIGRPTTSLKDGLAAAL
ncbi:SDR family oxidoreductase [Glaciihabitans sp. dw_435]|uniref:SDR family oxidoreductase n=1 Tax=Glaciihabitans sp. dw_435 TaxID=2720081 RepID=UPI001BD52D0D|nr:SDR family oxidoreductase [Glaciihabitans sp. dw_435]